MKRTARDGSTYDLRPLTFSTAALRRSGVTADGNTTARVLGPASGDPVADVTLLRYDGDKIVVRVDRAIKATGVAAGDLLAVPGELIAERSIRVGARGEIAGLR